MARKCVFFKNEVISMAKNKEVIAMNLLTSGSYQEAADKSAISINTLSRLRKDPEFQQVVQKVKKEMFQETMNKAQAASVKALEVLHTIMNDTGATDSSRVSAARTVLELGINCVEQEEIITKLEQLESRWR